MACSYAVYFTRHSVNGASLYSIVGAHTARQLVSLSPLYLWVCQTSLLWIRSCRREGGFFDMKQGAR